MIIVTAVLSFETEADRDAAVAATAKVQKATRDEESGCLAYCFAADPSSQTIFRSMNYGRIRKVLLLILITPITQQWWKYSIVALVILPQTIACI